MSENGIETDGSKLDNCPGCGRGLSRGAFSCPACGHLLSEDLEIRLDVAGLLDQIKAALEKAGAERREAAARWQALRLVATPAVVAATIARGCSGYSRADARRELPVATISRGEPTAIRRNPEHRLSSSPSEVG